MQPYRATTMHPPPASYYFDNEEGSIADTESSYSASTTSPELERIMTTHRRARTLPTETPRRKDRRDGEAPGISEGLYRLEFRRKPHHWAADSHPSQAPRRTGREANPTINISGQQYRMELIDNPRRRVQTFPTPAPGPSQRDQGNRSSRTDMRLLPRPPPRKLWVITGASGAGKSRVGRHLDDKLDYIFLEGDDYLTPELKEYEGSYGVLDDERLAQVVATIIDDAIWYLRHGAEDVVVACSALRVIDREAWRNAVLLANGGHGLGQEYITPATHPVHLRFIYLDINEDLSVETVAARRIRTSHHMNESAVPAQFQILQPPWRWEVDCFNQESLPREELKAEVEKHW
ncbi:hypothetical protein O988_00208 [Pseudogymnoascus sp. VKM F-3808]|nr:hypothetical protein O988_00208 [Pseudogymnoascus sp. VKM F-3808]